MQQLQPYLNFNGNCEEAMNLHKSVLGGELEINHFSDFAPPDQKPKPGDKDGVMHATLKNEGLDLMASDGMPDRAVVVGDNVNLSIAGGPEEADKLKKIFEGLSAGGKVTMPLSKQVWGDEFGMFIDKYGFHWMVNISSGTKTAK